MKKSFITIGLTLAISSGAILKAQILYPDMRMGNTYGNTTLSVWDEERQYFRTTGATPKVYESYPDMREYITFGHKSTKESSDKVNKEYIVDIKNSRKAAEKFAANKQKIADFKTQIKLQKKEGKAEYREKIAKLEQQNSDMKKKLADYKEEGKDKWEIFKTEFKHDMDDFDTEIKDLITENDKYKVI